MLTYCFSKENPRNRQPSESSHVHRLRFAESTPFGLPNARRFQFQQREKKRRKASRLLGRTAVGSYLFLFLLWVVKDCFCLFLFFLFLFIVLMMKVVSGGKRLLFWFQSECFLIRPSGGVPWVCFQHPKGNSS